MLNDKLKILHLEDSASDAKIVARAIRKGNITANILVIETEQEFRTALKEFVPDVIISDHSLPSFNSLQAFAIFKQTRLHVPFILVTATISEEYAVEVIKSGVDDYILKDRLERLPMAIVNAIKKLESENERKLFVETIMESERNYRRLAEELQLKSARLIEAQAVAKIGSWEIALPYRKMTWSYETYCIYGIESELFNPSYESVLAFTHPDDKEKVINHFTDSIKHAGTSVLEHRIVTPDGIVKIVEEHWRVYHDAQGQPIRATGTCQDITRRKRDEHIIKESAANLIAIVENIDAQIYSLDTDLNYLTFNSLLKKTIHGLFGVEVQAGSNIAVMLAKLEAEDAEEWMAYYREALKGKPVHFIKEINVGDDHYYSSISINPIMENETVIGLSCLVRDITRETLAQIEIIALNETLETKVKERTAQLQMVNKELEAFSYTVSHDLQAPLRSLCNFSNILLNGYADKLDADGKEFLKIIDASATRMNDLIRDLLAFSKLGKAAMAKKAVNMQELVNIVLYGIRLEGKSLNTKIKLNKLGSAQSDPALVKQVWANLISNAIKYSSKKENPEIEIGMKEVMGENVYYVTDNGVGFDMKYSDKLFKVFQRLHGQADFEGTGVGLATVERIINRHGGRIWGEGKVDEGASFYFTLPNAKQVTQRHTLPASGATLSFRQTFNNVACAV